MEWSLYCDSAGSSIILLIIEQGTVAAYDGTMQAENVCM